MGTLGTSHWTGLLLVTAYEPSTATGDTTISLTMGTLGTSFSSRFFHQIVGWYCKHFSAQLTRAENYASLSYEP